MKRVAIVSRKMITGGVERALIAMLKHIDYTATEVDLYLEALGGELFEELPKEVQCIQLPSVHGAEVLRHPLFAVRKLMTMLKLHSKRYSYIEQCWLSSQMLMPIRKEYDVAIAYHAPNTVPVFYVIDGLKARKKILWLHSDLENNAGDTELALHYHSRYDQVFAVSRSALDSFIQYHPEMRSRVSVFPNYIDAEDIRRKSYTGPAFSDEFSGIHILSIGRLDDQKGFDLAVTSCKDLIDQGYPIRWYVCGEGAGRDLLEHMIRENGLGGQFVLLGNQPNPYGYLRCCDLYVQPSRFEGYCITAHEARVLAKPVVITDVAGARDQFVDGVTGWIVPIDADAITQQVAYCLEHPQEVQAVQARLKDVKFEQADQIDAIFDEVRSDPCG